MAKLCLELHGQQNVYNVETLFRLRDAVGPMVGANFDPSHLFWMGADPLAATRVLAPRSITCTPRTRGSIPPPRRSTARSTPSRWIGCCDRSWSYVTLGYGHDVHWWREFCSLLRLVGYDDVLSIEHEDLLLPPLDGVRRSVELLRSAI